MIRVMIMTALINKPLPWRKCIGGVINEMSSSGPIIGDI
jgi:hypothetical protein